MIPGDADHSFRGDPDQLITIAGRVIAMPVRVIAIPTICSRCPLRVHRQSVPVPSHLMGEPDFAAPEGLVKYGLGLVFILLFNVPLLYGGIAAACNLDNAATSIALVFASALFGIAGWGLYGFRNLARLLTLQFQFSPSC